jgi:excisionase family DNA binding protein
MPALNERAIEALEAAEATRLASELQGIREPRTHAAETASLTVDDRTIALGPEIRDAVLDLLQRLADGHAVVVASTDALLSTSQAAELIGISATYLLRLANNGTIPVEYRGTHRRFRLADAMRYLEESKRAAAKRSAAAKPRAEP